MAIRKRVCNIYALPRFGTLPANYKILSKSYLMKTAKIEKKLFKKCNIAQNAHICGLFEVYQVKVHKILKNFAYYLISGKCGRPGENRH